MSFKIKYSTYGKGLLSIINTNTHIQYDIGHTVISEKYSNNWRIQRIAYRDTNGMNSHEIATSNGEFELAIHSKQWNDFIGGYQHGYENNPTIIISIDNREVVFSDIANEQLVHTIDIYEKTDLIDISSKQKIAEHYRNYIFEGNDLILKQSVKWLNTVSIDIAYLGMMPIDMECTINNNVIDTINQLCFSDGTKIEVSNDISRIKQNWCVMRSNISNISCRFEILNNMSKHTKYNKFIIKNNNNPYNKLYNCFIFDDVKTYNGEIWKSNVKYTIISSNEPNSTNIQAFQLGSSNNKKYNIFAKSLSVSISTADQATLLLTSAGGRYNDKHPQETYLLTLCNRQFTDSNPYKNVMSIKCLEPENIDGSEFGYMYDDNNIYFCICNTNADWDVGNRNFTILNNNNLTCSILSSFDSLTAVGELSTTYTKVDFSCMTETFNEGNGNKIRLKDADTGNYCYLMVKNGELKIENVGK